MSEQISTVEEVHALPAECLLRSTRPGYGPTYVVTFDCGDGEVMIGVPGEVCTLSAKEVLDEWGPLELVYGPFAGEIVEAASDLVWLSEWIDAGNAQRDPEAVTWGRLAKLSEETGEVVAAYIGMTGQNPRKGVTHTLQDVFDELLDVAVTALGAAEHLAGHQGAVLEGLLVKIHAVAQRAREADHA